MLHKADLPPCQADWQPILAGALGSPDSYGRQLNGMGGGVSSLSKVCVISCSSRDDADVDYMFIQMGIKNGRMDLAGTCGNMAAAVGPFAVDERLVVPATEVDGGERMASVRIFVTNTQKVIHTKFPVEGSNPSFKSRGDYAIDGVPGTGSRIALSFLSPGGAKTGRTLPTGHPVDSMDMTGMFPDGQKSGQTLAVSLVDVANPAVVILAFDIGVRGDVLPDQLDADREKMGLLEKIRREGARMMGMDPTVDSIPKMVLVSAPQSSADIINLVARVLSMGQTHKAVPLTIALSLGVASQIPGTLPHSVVKGRKHVDRLVVGHPSGKLEVGAKMRDGHAESAVLHRTARPLMRGEVYWR